jgi:hypothetical protein
MKVRNDSSSEVSLLPARHRPHEQFEGTVGGVELISLVLQLLDPLQDGPGELVGHRQASSVGLVTIEARPACSLTTIRVWFPTRLGEVCS